jgi:hypothetical protein
MPVIHTYFPEQTQALQVVHTAYLPVYTSQYHKVTLRSLRILMEHYFKYVPRLTNMGHYNAFQLVGISAFQVTFSLKMEVLAYNKQSIQKTYCGVRWTDVGEYAWLPLPCSHGKV